MLIPLYERVIVRRQKAPEKVGAIIVPDMAKEKPILGVVLAVAADVSLKVGDTVLFSKYAGQEIEHKGETLLCLKAQDIIAIVQDS